MPVTTGFRRRTFGGRAPPRRMLDCRKALGVWKRRQPSADARQVSYEHLAEIVEQVPPIRDLDGVGCSFGDRTSVFGRAVACDDLDAGMIAEPRRDGRRRPVRE